MTNVQLTPNEREQELRMRCLDMATRGPQGGVEHTINAAQQMYDFAMGVEKSGDEAKKAA